MTGQTAQEVYTTLRLSRLRVQRCPGRRGGKHTCVLGGCPKCRRGCVLESGPANANSDWCSRRYAKRSPCSWGSIVWMVPKAKAAPTALFEAGDLVRSKSGAGWTFEVEAVKWDPVEGAQALLGPAPDSLGRQTVWYDARRFELVRHRKRKGKGK